MTNCRPPYAWGHVTFVTIKHCFGHAGLKADLFNEDDELLITQSNKITKM